MAGKKQLVWWHTVFRNHYSTTLEPLQRTYEAKSCEFKTTRVFINANDGEEWTYQTMLWRRFPVDLYPTKKHLPRYTVEVPLRLDHGGST